MICFSPIGFVVNIDKFTDLSADSKNLCKVIGLYSIFFPRRSDLCHGVGIGSVSYSNVKCTEKGAVEYFKDGQLRFNLNNASVNVRFYL